MKPEESFFLISHRGRDVRCRWLINRNSLGAEKHYIYIDDYRGEAASEKFDREVYEPSSFALRLCQKIDDKLDG